MNKTGLVLSGGGARGMAHLGVLKVLDEMGVKVSVVSGTSAGAIVGVFYAAGFSPDEILEIAQTKKFFGFSNLLIGKAGFFDMKPFEKVYREFFPDNRLEALPIPVYVTTTDIVKGETRYYSKGELSSLLMASSCVPLVFQPVTYDGTIMMDGGILNNFPVEPLLYNTEQIIGVHVNALSDKVNEIHMKDMLDRSFHIAMRGQLKEKSKHCSIFLDPPDMSRFGMFDLSKAKEIFDFGYAYASARRGEMAKALEL